MTAQPFPGELAVAAGAEPPQYGALLTLQPSGVARCEEVWNVLPGASYSDLPKENVARFYAVLLADGAVYVSSPDRETVSRIRTALIAGLDAIMDTRPGRAAA